MTNYCYVTARRLTSDCAYSVNRLTERNFLADRSISLHHTHSFLYAESRGRGFAGLLRTFAGILVSSSFVATGFLENFRVFLSPSR